MLKSYTKQEFNSVFLEPANYLQDLINYSKKIVEKNVSTSEELKLDENKKYLELTNKIDECEKSKYIYLYFISEILNKDFASVCLIFNDGLTNFLLPEKIELWTSTEEKGINHSKMTKLMVAQILDFWLPLACKISDAIGYSLTTETLKEIRNKEAKEQANILFEAMVKELDDDLFKAYTYSSIVYTIAKLNSHCYQLLYPTLDDLYDNSTAKNYKDLFGDKKLVSSLMKGSSENE